MQIKTDNNFNSIYKRKVTVQALHLEKYIRNLFFQADHSFSYVIQVLFTLMLYDNGNYPIVS